MASRFLFGTLFAWAVVQCGGDVIAQGAADDIGAHAASNAIASLPASPVPIESGVDTEPAPLRSVKFADDDELPPGVPKIFEPEDDWKEVLRGQHVPGGLEIRMDLSKGGRWARKIAKSPAPADATKKGSSAGHSTAAALLAASSAVVIAPDTGDVLSTSEATGTGQRAGTREDDRTERDAADLATLGLPVDLDPKTARMASILLGLPEPEPELASLLSSGEAARISPEKLQALLQRVWDKRQEELRVAFSKAKTEAQQMQALLSRLLDPRKAASSPTDSAEGMSVEESATILEDLEYYVTTVHNAEDFGGMGGLTAMALLTNSSDPRVASGAAWVIGTAVKNAPTVQATALQQGAIPALLNLLADCTRRIGVAFAAAAEDHDYAEPVLQTLRTTSKTVYALGGLLRYCPEGQTQFVRSGGQQMLANAVKAVSTVAEKWQGADVSQAHHSAARQAASCASKMLTLVADLVQEMHASPDGRAEGKSAVLRIKTSNSVDQPNASSSGSTSSPEQSSGTVPITRLDTHAGTVLVSQMDNEIIGTGSARVLCDDAPGFATLCHELLIASEALRGRTPALDGGEADHAAVEVANQIAAATSVIAGACGT